MGRRSQAFVRSAVSMDMKSEFPVLSCPVVSCLSLSWFLRHRPCLPASQSARFITAPSGQGGLSVGLSVCHQGRAQISDRFGRNPPPSGL